MYGGRAGAADQAMVEAIERVPGGMRVAEFI
jgi:hypothetical protein